jgi:hypothetical protein
MRCAEVARERDDWAVRAAPLPLHARQRASHTWMGVCLVSGCCSCSNKDTPPQSWPRQRVTPALFMECSTACRGRLPPHWEPVF